MKKLATIISILVFSIIFSQCSASKINETSQNNPPFKVINAVYSTWAGEQPDVKGINIKITIDNPEIQLDTVFFRNMKTTLIQEVNTNPPIFVGSFMFPTIKNDYILHENPVKEYGNTPPNISINIPFELKKNEAVISYLFNGNTHYYKIENLIEVKPKQYTSKNKQ